jgi:hypothetical protein
MLKVSSSQNITSFTGFTEQVTVNARVVAFLGGPYELE